MSNPQYNQSEKQKQAYLRRELAKEYRVSDDLEVTDPRGSLIRKAIEGDAYSKLRLIELYGTAEAFRLLNVKR